MAVSFCCVLHAAQPACAATLTVMSPPALSDTGQSARVCIGLTAGGDTVAAVQNDMRWDGSCASMVGSCQANSATGKDLSAAPRGSDGMRAILISFRSMKPIADGELYCCQFNVDLAPGGCCPVEITAASASDPSGQAVSANARNGQICLSSSASGSSGVQPRAGREQAPVMGADLGAGGQPSGQAPAAPAAPAAPGAVGGAPPAVVMQGGGARPGEPQAPPAGAEPAQEGGEAPAAAPPAAQRPAAPGVPGQVAQAPAATPRPTQPAAAPEAPAAAPVEQAPAAKPPVAAAPTRPKPVAAQPVAPAATPESSGCHCEIGANDSGGSALASLLLLAVVLWARRRRI